jgi:DNA-directed RNA polymerase subunit RPC12/RpoP
MKGTKRYREIEKSDWYRGILLLLLFIVMITLSSVFLLLNHWYLWMAVVFGSTLLIVVWHTKKFAYRCPNCNEVFEISVIDNFLGPNHITKKYLKCPKCGNRGWAQIMVIRK